MTARTVRVRGGSGVKWMADEIRGQESRWGVAEPLYGAKGFAEA